MTVALRPGLARGEDPLAGTVLTLLPAVAVVATGALVRGEANLAAAWPFLLAGLLAPGVSQALFTFAIRDAGTARTSATVGTAPLFAVVFAIVLLGEPVVAEVVMGAVLIVLGGIVLASERGRPAHVKTIGLVLALGATVAFASRDTFVRWLAVDTEVNPELAVTATLLSGTVAITTILLLSRRPLRWSALPAFAPAGVLFGLSYLCLFEAFYRGRLSVVAPLVATECLWGVTLSAIFLRRQEFVGTRLFAGAAFVVAGGALIGVYR
jgi:drug/metabolite transporter (DMT)-like permease